MRSIGIRELRQDASRHLRDVERGETIEVTDRGRPVARLVPVPEATGVEALIASGRITPPKGDLMEWLAANPPLEPEPGKLPLSEVLAEMREHER